MLVFVRAILYAVLFMGLVLIWAPGVLLAQLGVAQPAVFGAAQWLGAAVTTAGLLLAVLCVTTFARIGRGTPAPFDPPRRLVTSGPYRYVRNPMYLGAGLALLGLALYYQSWLVIGYTLILLALVSAFIRLYEEPNLHRLFGMDYAVYCERVPRWIPMRPPAA